MLASKLSECSGEINTDLCTKYYAEIQEYFPKELQRLQGGYANDPSWLKAFNMGIKKRSEELGREDIIWLWE